MEDAVLTVDLDEATVAPVWCDHERMGGEPCFRGSRVPIRTLFDALVAGQSLADFRDDFPTVPEASAGPAHPGPW